MNIVLNFVPLKSGGGVQVGLDFIEQAKRLGSAHQWFLVCTAGTPFANVRETPNLRLLRIVERSASARLWFEYIGCRALLRQVSADIVYTQFGPQWPGAGAYQNVVGCAYSNLLYPEIDFWGRYPLLRRISRRLIDMLRRARLYRADLVIFETQDLVERAVHVLKLDRDRVVLAKPAPSSLVSAAAVHVPTRSRCARLPRGFRILLLSVYNPNKNIELLAVAANEIRRRSPGEKFVFIITLPQGAASTDAVMRLAAEQGVSDHLYNFGPVPHEGCAELYRACDAVILPSQLESFSNTIAEAWTMRKPLVISDMDWSRSLCADAALYIKYADAAHAAGQLIELRRDDGLRRQLIEAGAARLASFPTSAERFTRYLSLIEEVASRSLNRRGDYLQPSTEGSET